MIKRFYVALLLFGTSAPCFALEFGLSSSGKDIALELATQIDESNWGAYSRIVLDFEDYQNGSQVTVCRDGAISGSTGRGTCSGHSGVSHSKEAEFDRTGVAVGPTYRISQRVQVHGGLFIGLYSSDVNIGETSVNDFSEVGVDVGLSLKPFPQSGAGITVTHETDQGRTLFGLKYEF